MSKRTRAERRAARRKAWAKARWLGRIWFEDGWQPSDQWLGRMASTHCRPCSCWFLCHARPSKKAYVTAEVSFREQVDEWWQDQEESKRKVKQIGDCT